MLQENKSDIYVVIAHDFSSGSLHSFLQKNEVTIPSGPSQKDNLLSSLYDFLMISQANREKYALHLHNHHSDYRHVEPITTIITIVIALVTVTVKAIQVNKENREARKDYFGGREIPKEIGEFE